MTLEPIANMLFGLAFVLLVIVVLTGLDATQMDQFISQALGRS